MKELGGTLVNIKIEFLSQYERNYHVSILFIYHQSQATHCSQPCDVLPTITYIFHFLLSQIVNGSHPLTHFIFVVMACRITRRDFCSDLDDFSREKY